MAKLTGKATNETDLSGETTNETGVVGRVYTKDEKINMPDVDSCFPFCFPACFGGRCKFGLVGKQSNE